MTDLAPRFRVDEYALASLGEEATATLYLDRCQVDTPNELVKTVWDLLKERRTEVGSVVDFGAGDARFARYGKYASYLGYEIDPSRCSLENLPGHAEIVNACAFFEGVHDADLAIGNPPYVRNQDLPDGWREKAAITLKQRTGVKVSGLANAWQYFFLLSIASTNCTGLVALVIPFEWVSRPSCKALREYIKLAGWTVDVYRLHDRTFDRVLTTSSITIVDKANSSGTWTYHRENEDGTFSAMRTPAGGRRNPLPYTPSRAAKVVARRGLSPGTQKCLTLTEGERARTGLAIGVDVVRCVTSLRQMDPSIGLLDEATFEREFVRTGRKCWLVRTDAKPSSRLQRYLDAVPAEDHDTSTCNDRTVWWKFTMPSAPPLLMATGFKSKPKVVENLVGAHAVGGVCGIYGASRKKSSSIRIALQSESFVGRVVSHSNGLQKLEINQINALLGMIETSWQKRA